MKKSLSLIMLLITVSMIVIAGCSTMNNQEKNTVENSEKTNESNSSYPVTIENAGQSLTFEKAPERVYGAYQQEAELLAELDLQDKLVGYSMIIKNTPAEYKEKLQDVPILSEDSYPSKEVLLEADPEIIIGSERSFNENGVGTIEELNDLGIDAYVTESEKPETVENMVYKEIEEISQIFGVEDRGDALIENMQDEIDEVTAKIEAVDEPVKVLLMSGGESGSAQVAGGNSLDSHLIELAGGENIFADEEEYLLEVSWEEIVERDPDVIVTSYCCGTGPEDLERVIESNVSLQDVTAVKNENYIAAQVEDTTGNVRVAKGVRILAEGFYPDLFD